MVCEDGDDDLGCTVYITPVWDGIALSPLATAAGVVTTPSTPEVVLVRGVCVLVRIFVRVLVSIVLMDLVTM